MKQPVSDALLCPMGGPCMDKARGRPFQPGNTFGRGRPKGSRNSEKLPEQRILDDFAPHLIRKCVALALNGDRTALRLCMDRISPPRRDAYIRMNFAPIKKARDIDRAAEKVTEAIRLGELTPYEGETLMNILESRSRVIERADLEKRLEKLEQNLHDSQPGGG
jgi:hypothetical protein